MKNKEIEELLKNFQEVFDNPTTTDECYDGRIIEIDRTYDLEQDEIKLLLSYIEQLENNRDKAIEVINTQLKNAEGGLKDNLRIIKFNLIKGSCTFEDLKTEEDYKYILKGDSDE